MTNPERLRAWGELFDSQERAAERLGIGQAHFNHLIGRNRSPSLALAAKIEQLTADWADGPIRAVEWIEAPGHSSSLTPPVAAGECSQ